MEESQKKELPCENKQKGKSLDNVSQNTPQTPPKKKPRRKLTIKQRAFIQEYLRNNGNGTQAALKTYDTKEYFVANSISTENLQKPLIQSEMRRLFEASGLSPQKFSEEIALIVTDRSLTPKDKSPYFRLYADCTPSILAPTRTEETKDIHIQIDQRKIEAIVDLTRQTLKQAKG